MPENHILLLPRINYYRWARTSQKYALHFKVEITPDPTKVGDRKIVSVVISQNSYPHEGDIIKWLKERYPDINIDPIIVEGPEVLEKVLDRRIEKGIKYGKLYGVKEGSGVLPKFPTDRFYLFWPTDYPSIIQPFGVNPEIYCRYGLPGHEGVDIRAPYSSNVYACAAGEVYYVEDGSTTHKYGRHIRIRHAQGYRTIYAHLERVLVRVGEPVRARQLIGRADSTGNSSGHHLHLTLKKDRASEKGETDYPRDIIDPTPYLVYKHQESEVFEALGIHQGTDSTRNYPWPQPCLVGITSRFGGMMQDADFSVIEKARIEAVRIDAKTSTLAIEQLKNINPELFLLAKLGYMSSVETISPSNWLEGMRLDIERLYRKGVRYFEIHQSPNLHQHGWRTSWYSGEHFGHWWQAVAEKLWVEFSGVKLGFPGLSPGGQVPGQRMDSEIFMDGADSAMNRADWLGVNCFWNNDIEMSQYEKGGSYRVLRNRFPDKLLFITEFGNLNPYTSHHAKGSEYVEYYQQLREVPGIGAAFSQVVSALEGYETLVWRNEDGKFSEIVEVVGNRPF